MIEQSRHDEMVKMRSAGNTLQEIGTKYGVTRERVRQILLQRHEQQVYDLKCFTCGLPFTSFKETAKFCDFHREMTKGFSGRDLIRQQVRMRDNFTCQDCKCVWKDRERRFDVHHLHGLCGKKSRGYDSYTDMEGLLTLCHKCHMSKHAHVRMLEGVRRVTLEKETAARVLIKAGFSIGKTATLLNLTYSNLHRKVGGSR